MALEETEVQPLYTCTCCRREGVPEAEMAPTRIRKDGTRGYSWCRECKRESVRISHIKVLADPVKRAHRRKQERDAKRRKRATDAEAAERMREQVRRTAKRTQADPEKREHRNRRGRERRLWLKANDPEGYQRLLEKERERNRRWKRQAGVRARVRETQRMYQQMKRHKRGAARKGPRIDFVAKEPAGRLPAAPVVALVEVRVEARKRELGLSDGDEGGKVYGAVLEQMALSERRVRDMRAGRQKAIGLDVVDRMLQATGLMWWEVYDAELWPEEHKAARRLFVGKVKS